MTTEISVMYGGEKVKTDLSLASKVDKNGPMTDIAKLCLLRSHGKHGGMAISPIRIWIWRLWSEILTYKDGPCTKRIKIFILAVDPWHRYSNKAERAN